MGIRCRSRPRRQTATISSASFISTSLHDDFHSEQSRRKRNRQIFFQHGENAGDLFGFVVTVHGGFVDQLVEGSQIDSLRSLLGPSLSSHSSGFLPFWFYPGKERRDGISEKLFLNVG